jgi:hypothetical protein
MQVLGRTILDPDKPRTASGIFEKRDRPEQKKYLPQRLKDTKDIFIILFSCLGALVAMKKVCRKIHKFYN